MAMKTVGIIKGMTLAWGFLILCILPRCLWGQNMSTGNVYVTVEDQTGAAVAGAQLELKDLDTNDVRTVKTQSSGDANFPDLNFGHYSLTITKEGFATKTYASVLVQTNQTTAIKAELSIGAVTQQVTVGGESTPILDSTSNILSTTLDLKQVQDLPLSGRDTFPLAFLVPGAVGNDFNNLPGGAVNESMNGFSNIDSIGKSAGFYGSHPVVTARLEDVQEMTVQTGELDASKGGNSAMDIDFVTKRGTNKFHGLLYEDYRNDAMNANSWYNNYVGLPRPKLIINDFGASVGGPVVRNKLFFFVSLSNFREPVKFTVSTPVATPLALSGTYQYYPQGSNALQSTNVLQTAQAAGFPGTVNPTVAGELANIQSSYKYSATLAPLDPNHDLLSFLDYENIIQKYPTARFDYNISNNFRLTGMVNASIFYSEHHGGNPYPGPLYANMDDTGIQTNYQVVTGFDWNIKPNVVNAFRVGYQYEDGKFNTQGVRTPTPSMLQLGDVYYGFNMNSGVNANNLLSSGSLTPALSIKDQTTWQHGAHDIQFGAEGYTEIWEYFNSPFVPFYAINGIVAGDPVATTLDAPLPPDAPSSAPADVQSLYATLTGRVNYYDEGEYVNPITKQYQAGTPYTDRTRLTESALFIEDAWNLRPDLMLNMGLRWNFTGAVMDETGIYAHPSVRALWGPTPVGALFQPGNFSGGDPNPVIRTAPEAYYPSYVLPQPNFGFSWNPKGWNGTLGRLLGGGANVYRGSITFKNYTEGTQNFYNFGSNNGVNTYTYFQAQPVPPTPGVTPAAGFYNAGSFTLGGPLPALVSSSPIPYNPTVPEAALTFNGPSYLTFNPHIKQPYVLSWSFGIQHRISQASVLEVRYVGNVSKDQWLGVNYNEINIFENGFLKEFQNAQANLQASGEKSFQGPQPLPIMSTAFSGAPGDFTNGRFITDIQQGQAGAMANILASNPTYLCNLVGAANFSPCVANGFSGNGGYPINFFEVNPYAAGNAIKEETNQGYSNYNSLQLDFRQRPARGLEFDANYTLGKSMDNNYQGSTAPGVYGGAGPSGAAGGSAGAYYTLRDKHLNYLPSIYDIRNMFHFSGTYDLPFGHNQWLFNQSRIANIVIGGWTIGAILSYQSGAPEIFHGQTETVNTSDSGVVLTGLTPASLQKQMGVYHVKGHPWVDFINPKYITPQGQANYQYISPEFTPGQFGRILDLHTPKWINTDMAVTKIIPIRGALTFSLQGEFLNAFNHVAWIGGNMNLQATTFGSTSQTANGPRNIELRGNFQF